MKIKYNINKNFRRKLQLNKIKLKNLNYKLRK